MSILASVEQEIDWANKLIESAAKRMDAYVALQPFCLAIEDEPETGCRVYKIKRNTPVPREIAHELRNALLDLKHSFDRSLHLSMIAMGAGRDERNYPWADSRKGLKQILRKRQASDRTKIPLPLLKEILRQRPYPEFPVSSGKIDMVRELAKLANNKHSVGFEVTATPSASSEAYTYLRKGEPLEWAWDPDNDEMPIYRVFPGGHLSVGKMDFAIEIYFKTDGALKGVPAFLALFHFYAFAQACLEGFRSVVEP